MKSDERMSKQEMIERSFRALDEFDRLPFEERWRRMIEYGTIDENGDVLVRPTDEVPQPPTDSPERP